jgi:pSer/pThr/pTyr-binding forkhead associated (FHA) protein
MRPLNLILTVKTGPHAGKTHLISAGKSIRIGRTPESHLAFEADNFMSSVHFEIHNLGDGVEVRDLKSTNKTWVNNTPISAVKLQPGDTVRAGKTTFGWEWDESKTESNNTSGGSLHRRIDALIDAQWDKAACEDSQVLPSSELEKPWSKYLEDKPATDQAGSVLARMQLSNVEQFGNAVSELLRGLRRFKNTHVVAHFLKLGMTPPDSLSGECVIKGWEFARATMPTAIPVHPWLDTVSNQLTDRLCRTDGLMIVLMEDEADQGCLHRISKQAVRGFSESEGFLPWFWPRQWLGICEALSDREIRDLMGSELFGVIVPDPKRRELRSFVAKTLIPAMEELGFQNCEAPPP